MGTTVTPEQAKETYERTVKNEPRWTWAVWVLAIHNSLTNGQWTGAEGLPTWAKETYDLIKAENKISTSDSI